jgi:HAD superfamily hydrolase (TIGR01456 family)
MRRLPFVALDIDGVLIRGGKPIPDAKHALEILMGKNRFGRPYPFILLTNGGGVMEETKAKQMSSMFNLEIRPEQVVLAHSPMRSLVKPGESWWKDHVLCIGKNSVKDVARAYGFKNAVLTDEILGWNPHAWPFRYNDGIKPKDDVDVYKVPFGGVLVFHDSRDWGRDLQIALDVLRSPNRRLDALLPRLSKMGASEPKQTVPIYFSNQDFVWATEFHRPRFAQGAFRKCLETLFKELTGDELQVAGQCGKPFPETYTYATQVLRSIERKIEQQQVKSPAPFLGGETIYAVGDNIASDIVGANIAGWNSILVKTGVYQPGDKFEDAYIPEEISKGHDLKRVAKPKHIVEDVLDAIELIEAETAEQLIR